MSITIRLNSTKGASMARIGRRYAGAMLLTASIALAPMSALAESDGQDMARTQALAREPQSRV